MYKNKKILAIIPARSGSKGLPNKNIRELLGKPLIAHSILVAKESKIIDEVFVSTDSAEYAKIAKEYGANIPFLRPEEISGDRSQAYDYIRNALDTYKDKLGEIFDYFIVLQPTSPIRTTEHIKSFLSLLIDEDRESAVSVCEAEHIPQLYNTLPDNQTMKGFFDDASNGLNRQSFGKYYRLNGSLYGMNVESFYKYNSYYIDNSRAFIMEKKFSVDIDDELDFYICEKIYIGLKRGEL